MQYLIYQLAQPSSKNSVSVYNFLKSNDLKLIRDNTMKAIIFPKYGSPEVLQLKEIEKPIPKKNEVLIKVHAAAANPLDWHRLEADPWLVRFSDGFFTPKDPRLGADMAGVIEEVGSEVTEFKPGDAVFGCSKGAFAEYTCFPEDLVALKPDHLSFDEAASIPIVGYTALQGLRDYGMIQSGQKVLINGASGGVGTAAVQIAKSYDCEVTGVCSTRNLELVQSIGADHVVDYKTTDFTNTGTQYDLIYDAIGNRSVHDLKGALEPGGICSVAGFTTMSRLLQIAIIGGWVSKTSDKKIGLMGTARPNKNDLNIIKEYLESEKLKAVIDRKYPFEQTAEAIAYLEDGHARGKVIITIQQ